MNTVKIRDIEIGDVYKRQFLVSVIANVVSYYICKWLSGRR